MIGNLPHRVLISTVCREDGRVAILSTRGAQEKCLERGSRLVPLRARDLARAPIRRQECIGEGCAADDARSRPRGLADLGQPWRRFDELSVFAYPIRIAWGTEGRKHRFNVQECRGRFKASQRTVTAPSPVGRSSHEVRFYRIHHDVPADFAKVIFFLHNSRMEASLQKVAGVLMAAIPPLRVAAVETLHSRRQVGPYDAQHQVIVIVHQTVSEARDVVTFVRLLKEFEKSQAVHVVTVDRHAPVASGRHVIDQPR